MKEEFNQMKYLFRGKYMPSGKWIYGSLIEYPDRKKYLISNKEIMSAVVDGNSVGIYTGHTDKAGTKVFEGDILKMTFKLDDGDEEETEILLQIKWNEELCGFMLKESGCNVEQDIEGVWSEATVVGNIYDNPDMVK